MTRHRLRFLAGLLIAIEVSAALAQPGDPAPVEIAKDVPAALPRVKNLKSVTKGPKHHFCACYYGICPFDATGRSVAVLETDFGDRLAAAGDRAKICLADLTTGELKPIAQTSAWNFQQGAMVHWLGTAP